MSAFAGEQTAIISWIFTSWTGAVEVYLTDSADVVVGYVPSPCCYRIPLLDLDLHLWSCINIKFAFSEDSS